MFKRYVILNYTRHLPEGIHCAGRHFFKYYAYKRIRNYTIAIGNLAGVEYFVKSTSWYNAYMEAAQVWRFCYVREHGMILTEPARINCRTFCSLYADNGCNISDVMEYI